MLPTNVKQSLRIGDNVIAYHVHNTTGGANADIGLFANVKESYNNIRNAVQTSCDVIATNTYYTFQCGGVDLRLVFTAPMFLDDLNLLSTPINYISYQVRANDKRKHNVQIFFELKKTSLSFFFYENENKICIIKSKILKVR